MEKFAKLVTEYFYLESFIKSKLSKETGSNELFWNLLMIPLLMAIFSHHKYSRMSTTVEFGFFAVTAIFTTDSLDVCVHVSMVKSYASSRIFLQKSEINLDYIFKYFCLLIPILECISGLCCCMDGWYIKVRKHEIQINGSHVHKNLDGGWIKHVCQF